MDRRGTPTKGTITPARPPTGVEPIYVGYLIAQAVIGVLWWATLLTSPTVRSWFEMNPDQHAALDAFVFADLVVVISGSLLSAWGIRTRASWAVPVVAFTAGCLVYPTLYLVSWVAFTGAGSLVLAGMVVVSTMTSWIAYGTWRSRG